MISLRLMGIFIGLFLMISCRNSDKGIENDNLVNERFRKNEQDKKFESFGLKTPKERVSKEDIKRLIERGSPLGVYLQTNFGSDSEYFKFGKDSLVWHSWGYQYHCLVGKWYMEGNDIMIRFYKQIGQRGIGSPLPPMSPVPGNYVDEYEEYEKYIEEVTDSTEKTFTAYIDWKEVVEHLSSSDEFKLYVVLDIMENPDISELDEKVSGKYPEASYRLLNEEDLEGISPKELRLMRNEIMARHGLIFKSNDLKTYFSKTDWYSGYREKADMYLSKIEEQNIALIKQKEFRK